MGETPPMDNQRRWSQSRAYLREAHTALDEGRTHEALRLFTQAHDLGGDNTICHARGHFGRMRVELQTGKLRDALLDGFFGLAAVLISPIRRWRGVRGRGFGATARER